MLSFKRKSLPSGEDIIEMSGVDTLHPGGFDLSKHIGDLVNFNSTKHVLDVSSGKGTFACYYAEEFGCNVTGIDINKEFINISKKKVEERGLSNLVEFEIGDSTNLNYPDNYFDVVVNECAVGLTVINKPQTILNEMYRVVKPGGSVVIHESIWLKELSQAKKDDLATKIGTTPYTVEEWCNMLKESKIEIEIVEDWSGIENLQKMRPNHKWDKRRPLDFMTSIEKFKLVNKLILRYGIGSLFILNNIQKDIITYFEKGYYGYALFIGKK